MKTFLVYTLAALLAVPHAQAQSPRTASGQSDADMWREFAMKLDAGAPVRVRTRDGKSVEGHLIQVMPDGVRINPKTRMEVPIRSIAFADISKIERRGEGWSPGAKVFLGVGIGAGAAVILFISLLSHLD